MCGLMMATLKTSTRTRRESFKLLAIAAGGLAVFRAQQQSRGQTRSKRLKAIVDDLGDDRDTRYLYDTSIALWDDLINVSESATRP